MKDEIKEKIKAYYVANDIDKIIDYITNLQTIEQQYSAILSENAELENKITNLQERNKELIIQQNALSHYLSKQGLTFTDIVKIVEDFKNE